MTKEQSFQGYPKLLTFEQVWTILQESAKRQAEWQEETVRRNAEWQAESAKRIAELQAESAKRIAELQAESAKRIAELQAESTEREAEWQAKRRKEQEKADKEHKERLKEIHKIRKESRELQKENDRKIGKLGNRIGEMIECMIKPDLLNKFRKLGFVFNKIYHDTVIKDEKNNIHAQVDLTLENGDKVMIVEVKNKPTTEYITDHIERMKKLKLHADLHGDKRTYFGAIAGMVVNDNERNFALKNGFYVIQPSGENFIIIPPEGEPKVW